MNRNSNIFQDISILNIRKIDETYPCKEINYRDLSNSYSFLCFDKASSSVSERDVTARRILSKNEISGQPVDLLRILSERGTNIDMHSDGTNIFYKGVEVSFKREMLPILNLKERVYEQLVQKYEEIKADEKGEITILPISFYCQSASTELGDIVTAFSIMNRAFNLTMSKLNQRTMGRRIISYKRLSMLNENFEPFIHVLFYIRDGGVSESFVAEILAVWASKIPADNVIRIILHSFNFEFLCSLWQYFLSRESESISKKASPHELTLSKTVFFGDILMPFPNVRLSEYNEYEPFYKLYKLIRDNKKNKSGKRSFNVSEIAPPETHSKIKNSSVRHKEYFLRIAKKMNKINFIRIIS